MSLRIKVLTILFIACSTTVHSQECTSELHDHSEPQAAFSSSDNSSEYINKLESLLSKDLNSNQHKYKKEINKYYTSRVEGLSNLAEKGHFYRDELLLQQINTISDKLIAANDINNSDRIQWVINRTGNPNAACFGEGTLMINLGLMSKMQNLDQIAFIMAHELGHHHLNHVNNKIVKNVEFINSKALQKKIKDAESDKAMARVELVEMLKDNSISSSKHSRDHESETDKVGYEFYINAGFPKEQAVEAMKILKNIDLSKYPDPDISSFFSECGTVWKDKWLVTTLSGLSLIKPSEEEIEKFRTHPKTDERIEQLLALGSAESDSNIDPDWCSKTMAIDIEILQYTYWTGNKFNALIQAVQLHQLNPKNEFVKGIAANCLADFVIAKDQHYFSKVVPSPNIKMKDHYFVMATFLDNINFSAFKEISVAWIQNEIDLENKTTEKSEAVEAIKIKLDIIAENNIDNSIEKFEKQWPDSRFFYK